MKVNIGPNFQICFIRYGRQIGIGFYSRRDGRGQWRTRHIFLGIAKRPLNFIGW